MPKLNFSTASPVEVTADVLVLPIFEGPEAGPGVKDVGRALGSDPLELYAANKLRGKLGESLTIPTLGRMPASNLVLVGVGKKDKTTTDSLRSAIGRQARRLSRFRTVATTLAQAAGRSAPEAIQATTEGLLLGSYRFDRYKNDAKDGDDKAALQAFTVLGPSRWDARKAREAIRRAEIVAESVGWARDLVNTPAQDATPDYLAKQAQRMAREVGLRAKIWGKDELKRGGFGGILGVGQGSENPPRMIELSYKGGGSAKPFALTGKGVTFDSGGLSIKDARGMEWMKADMAGAAAILAAMRAIGLMKPRINVIAAIPSSENLPSGSSLRPGDVLRHRGGKTSEVLNTDAEGRLILADAIAYLVEKNPQAIIDCATLTGAAVVALGEDISAVIGNDQQLIRDLIAAGEAAGEPAWELPLWEGYRRQLESPVADVKNIGNRYAGAITAALFLKEFVGDVPWAHLDVAGTAYAENPRDFWSKGATGTPARMVVRYLLDRAEKNGRRSSRR